MMMTTTQVLQRMKEVLMERGWTQGRLVNIRGEVCLVGAYAIVTYGDPTQYDEDTTRGEVIMALTDEAISRGFEHGPSFNDEEGRTFNEVIDFIDSVILAEKMKAATMSDSST